MPEFSSIANLEVRPTGMDAARREIERELGDIEIGVSANRPTGRGGGAIGSRGPEPAGIDISRRQLGQQEQLVELAEQRNEFLEELTETDFGGGGGGGGFGLGFASRGILGGAAAGVGGAAGLMGILSAARLGGGAFSPGIFGRGGTGRPGEVGPGGPDDPVSQAIADFISSVTGAEQVGREQRPGPQGVFENILGFFSDLQVPERGTTDRRQNVEQGDQINQFDIQTTVSVDALNLDERQIETIVERKARETREEILRFLDRTTGGGTTPRTTGDPGGATGGPTAPGPGPV